jgi:uncharacterized protein with HEPN domain
MYRDDWAYVLHMLDSARRAVKAIEGKQRRDFDQDDDVVWQTTTEDLPSLILALESIIPGDLQRE